jgi:hypothetical protein
MRYNIFANDKNYALINYKIGSNKKVQFRIVDSFEKGIYTPINLTSYVKAFIVGLDYAKELTITNAVLGECEVDLDGVVAEAGDYEVEIWLATSLIITTALGPIVPDDKEVLPVIDKIKFVVEAANTFA